MIYFLNIAYFPLCSVPANSDYLFLVCIIPNYFTFKEVKKSQGLLFIVFYQHTHKDILDSIMVARSQSWYV